MAISVRDIQEKEFAQLPNGGYDVEQVDDFLDEIAEQMSALVRENLALNQRLREMEADLQTARQAAADAESRTPDYNEKGYFQNLQNAMRESLIGAQRIADETMEEATRKAQKTVSEAQAQAEQMTAAAREKSDALLAKAQQEAEKATADAKGQVEMLQARFEALKASAAAFKADFGRLLDQQAAAMRESNGLF